MSSGPIQIPERPLNPSYASPPIEEAICDLRFSPSEPWNATIPGLLYSALRDRYPQRPEDQQVQEVGIEVRRGDGPPRVTASRGHRVIMKDEGGRALLLVGEHQLGVNDLRPYSGWKSFRPRIEEAANAFCEVTQPRGVNRIGIRYINVLRVEGSEFDLGEYFTNAPRLDPSLGSKMRGFLLRTESFFEEDEVRLNATLTDTASPDGTAAVLLDLDVFCEWPAEEPLALSEVGEWIADLRQREYTAFEALITKQAREVFDKGDEVEAG